MTFFLDRNTPPGLLIIFQNARLQAVHHNSLFSETTQDPEIIEYVARSDYILLTYDRRMVHAHQVALREHAPRVVFLTATIGRMTISLQQKWYQDTLIPLCPQIQNLPPNTQVRVSKTGDIRVLWPPVEEEGGD